MSTPQAVDAARLSLRQADKEGWPAARFLVTIAEHELAEREKKSKYFKTARQPVSPLAQAFRRC